MSLPLVNGNAMEKKPDLPDKRFKLGFHLRFYGGIVNDVRLDLCVDSKKIYG